MNQKQKRAKEKKVLIVCTILVVIFEAVAAYITATGDQSMTSFCTPLMLVAATGTVVSWINYMRDRGDA